MSDMRHMDLPPRQRGVAALLAVALLCAAMAIVVIFTNRSLIFEQKTSANHYRSTIAMDAAEAGLEWATAMLNKSGRITNTCVDSSWDPDTNFRQKYLMHDPASKSWVPAAGSGAVVAACVTSQRAATADAAPAEDYDWICSCPMPGTAPSVTPPSVGGFKPGFAVALVSNAAARSVDVVSHGCTTAITSTVCTGDAAAMVRVTMADVAALASAPGVPLVARGAVNVGPAALAVQNSDPSTAGVTVHAGMAIDAANLRITSMPGTPPTATLIANDATLRSASGEQMFQTFLGMRKATWRDSVADAVLMCPCTQHDVAAALAAHKRKLWLQGDLSMNAPLALGSVDDPFVMIVDGDIEMSGDLAIYGALYAASLTWDNTGTADAQVVGAAISENDYSGNGTPSYVYDPRVVASLRAIPGRFVRVPGSWRDF